MSASMLPVLSVILTVLLLASYWCFVIATPPMYNHTMYATTSQSNPNSSSGPKTDTSTSCLLGPGKESHQVVNGTGEIWPYQVYKSSKFNPPALDITKDGQPLAPGLIFRTPSDGSRLAATKDTAPMIMTESGQLVWHGLMVNADNLRVASYEGKSILTYWSSAVNQGANIGHGYGNITFLDDTYTEVLIVCPRFGLRTPGNVTHACEADFHGSFVTDRDTLLVTAYKSLIDFSSSSIQKLAMSCSNGLLLSMFLLLRPNCNLLEMEVLANPNHLTGFTSIRLSTSAVASWSTVDISGLPI